MLLQLSDRARKERERGARRESLLIASSRNAVEKRFDTPVPSVPGLSQVGMCLPRLFYKPCNSKCVYFIFSPRPRSLQELTRSVCALCSKDSALAIAFLERGILLW